MLRERKDYPRVMTPKGQSIWPALNKPDFKFKEEFGEYHVRLRFDPSTPGLDEIVATAQEILDEAFEAKKAELTRDKKGALLKALNKADILKEELDPETGEPTGYVIFRAAMNAGGRRKKDDSIWRAKPDLFDARGKQLRNPPMIGSGSEIKVSARVMEYWMPKDKTIGVRFELEGAQIVKLVSGGQGQRSASDYGFGEEDGDAIDDLEDTGDGGFGDETGGTSNGGDDDDGGDF